ncbi:MAG: single-stranded DNA-binding protein [Anaerotignaceae bacterium]
MNKVILMGRLTRDPEVRYSQGATPVAVARFSLAVNRRFKRDGEADADFINCVSFGKNGEFVERFFKKGQLVSVVGRLQVRSWDDKEGKKQWTTEVVVEENYFAESKSSFESRPADSGYEAPKPTQQKPASNDGFFPVDESIEDDDLPF